MSHLKNKSIDYWKARLTPEQFSVCRLKGTEPPFSAEEEPDLAEGIYACVCCGLALFSSEKKFESGTGWPSFTEPIEDDRVELTCERGFFSTRTEVSCNQCGAHLGHLFDDGPAPTHKRYCVNSVALIFKPYG